MTLGSRASRSQFVEVFLLGERRFVRMDADRGVNACHIAGRA